MSAVHIIVLAPTVFSLTTALSSSLPAKQPRRAKEAERGGAKEAMRGGMRRVGASHSLLAQAQPLSLLLFSYLFLAKMRQAKQREISWETKVAIAPSTLRGCGVWGSFFPIRI